MTDINKKIRGCLLGGAVGDALGYQIEFKRNIRDKEVTRYKDKGIISDDTQMTLFTANALLWRATRLNLKGIAMKYDDAIYLGYLDWLNTQNNKKSENSISWIKEVSELNVLRAPGKTCVDALSSGKKGTIEKPINDSKGCGSVMRVAPIGLYIKDPDTAGEIGAKAGAITHGHPLGFIPCFTLSVMINLIVYGKKSIDDALNCSMKKTIRKYGIFNKNVRIFNNLIKKAIKLSKSALSDIEAIKQLGEGWVAEEAFAIAIYSCLKYSNSFENAIICAINHDGDSDSTGSIAGNIIGSYLGEQSIPEYYLENLELKDMIVELSDDLSIPVPVSEFSNTNDEYWLNKYLYCKRTTIDN